MNLPSAVGKHLRGLRHFGIVTEDSEALVARFKELFGLAESGIVRVPEPGAPAETRFVFLSIGGVPYEIVEPVSERFRKLLLNRGRGVNHICYSVEDLPGAVAAMAAAGVRLGHVTPDGMVEMPHARMAYFNPDDTGGVLLEFIESRK